MNPLDVAIKDNALVVSIPIDTLCFAAEQGELWPQDDMMNPTARITDQAVFAKAVLRELLREEEDGTTLVHLMFDKAFSNILENGCEGVDWGDI